LERQRDVSAEVPDLTNASTAIANKPAWVDLGTNDAAGARDFYSKLFGWDIQVSPDPQYGGYGRALSSGKDAAGIGPLMSPEQPSAWSLYIGTGDVDALANKVNARGVDAVLLFYQDAFGWALKPSGDPQFPYTEFEVDGESIGGATEMSPMARRRCRTTGWSTGVG
jgi:predicted enzyme related to lactoylglutathione lyase